MPKILTEDFTGKKFNRLTVIRAATYQTETKSQSGWLCACECGNQRIMPHSIVRQGKRMSCGCYRKDFHKVDPRSRLGKFEDLTGKVFGRLTVTGMSHRNEETGHYFFNCKCECGNETVVVGHCLKRGGSLSCGCWSSDCRKKHGDATRQNGRPHRSKEYSTWQKIKSRCLNPDDPCYPNYGGRGITIEAEWINDFPAFLAHIGRAPTPRHTVDRIDNERGYIKGNLRWASYQEQARNRRNNVFVDFRGKRMVKAAFCRAIGIDGGTLNYWLKKGYSPEQVYEMKKDTPKDVLFLNVS